MTAKEFLDSVKDLNDKINSKLKKLSDLQTRCAFSGGMDYSKERVQTSPDGEAQYARILDDIVDLQSEINADIDNYTDMRSVALRMLRYYFPEETVKIVWLRYNENCLWTEITQETGIKYPTAQRRYKKAMKELESTIYSEKFQNRTTIY